MKIGNSFETNSGHEAMISDPDKKTGVKQEKAEKENQYSGDFVSDVIHEKGGFRTAEEWEKENKQEKKDRPKTRYPKTETTMPEDSKSVPEIEPKISQAEPKKNTEVKSSSEASKDESVKTEEIITEARETAPENVREMIKDLRRSQIEVMEKIKIISKETSEARRRYDLGEKLNKDEMEKAKNIIMLEGMHRNASLHMLMAGLTSLAWEGDPKKEMESALKISNQLDDLLKIQESTLRNLKADSEERKKKIEFGIEQKKSSEEKFEKSWISGIKDRIFGRKGKEINENKDGVKDLKKELNQIVKNELKIIEIKNVESLDVTFKLSKEKFQKIAVDPSFYQGLSAETKRKLEEVCSIDLNWYIEAIKSKKEKGLEKDRVNDDKGFETVKKTHLENANNLPDDFKEFKEGFSNLIQKASDIYFATPYSDQIPRQDTELEIEKINNIEKPKIIIAKDVNRELEEVVSLTEKEKEELKNREIIIPEDINEKLEELANLDYEVQGFLYYKKQGNRCLVEGIHETGKGEVGKDTVEIDPFKGEIFKRFLLENKNYDFIEFHTHPKYLKDWSEKFSPKLGEDISGNPIGDILNMKAWIKDEKDSMFIMVAPKKRTVAGIGDFKLEVSNYEDSKNLSGKKEYIDNVLRNIEKKIKWEQKIDGILNVNAVREIKDSDNPEKMIEAIEKVVVRLSAEKDNDIAKQYQEILETIVTNFYDKNTKKLKKDNINSKNLEKMDIEIVKQNESAKKYFNVILDKLSEFNK